MSYQATGESALDYAACQYADCKMSFRGPRALLDEPYMTFLGGTETFGKFVSSPFPNLTARSFGCETLNIGAINAGIDLYLSERDLLGLTASSVATVVQVMSAANISNKYYSVHPRRNDRFVRASEALLEHAPGLELTEVHFTRHFLKVVYQRDKELFEEIRDELRTTWVARMEQLLSMIEGPKILLWFGRREPRQATGKDMGRDALFVDREMLEYLRPMVNDIAIVTPSEAAKAEGPRGMIFYPQEAPIAAHMLGVPAHQEASDQLHDVLVPVLSTKKARQERRA